MEIGGVGSGGFSYQDLQIMREAMAARGNSLSVNSASSVSTSINNAGASSSDSRNSNETKQQSTPLYTKNQNDVSANPAAGLMANAHRFAIDQAIRQTDLGISFNGLLSGLDNANKQEEALATSINTGKNAAMGVSDTGLNSMLASSLSLHSYNLSVPSQASAQASAVTSKYATQSQMPVLNSFKPIDKYV